MNDTYQPHKNIAVQYVSALEEETRDAKKWRAFQEFLLTLDTFDTAELRPQLNLIEQHLSRKLKTYRSHDESSN